MILIFNKQFRTEEKIISELMKKIKKSATVNKSCEGNTEKYEFDNLDVFFGLIDRKVVVTNKMGDKIMSMDCNYDAYDEMQKARANWFSELLDKARAREDKEKDKKMRMATANVKAPKQSASQEIAMAKALEQIRGL